MFSNPFSFDDRITRTEFCVSLLFYFLGYVILWTMYIGLNDFSGIWWLFIPLIWFLWAQGAKRCHDMDYSGWMQLVPFFGFWMMFSAGKPGPNSYGADPKARVDQTIMPEPAVLNHQRQFEQPVMPPPQKTVVPQDQLTRIEIANINYGLLQDVLQTLRKIDLTHSLTYEFMGTDAIISVNHKDTTQVLIDNLYNAMDQVEVLGVNDGQAKIKL